MLFEYVSESASKEWREVGGSLQEPGEEEGEETGGGEEEESAIACFSHRGEHVWNCTSNHEIKKLNIVSVRFILVFEEKTNPLSGSTQCDVDTAQSSSGNLRDVDPWHGAPAPLEEAGKEVDTNQCHVSCSWYIGAHHWRLDADVDAHI
jgi:hypothetical protein